MRTTGTSVGLAETRVPEYSLLCGDAPCIFASREMCAASARVPGHERRELGPHRSGVSLRFDPVVVQHRVGQEPVGGALRPLGALGRRIQIRAPSLLRPSKDSLGVRHDDVVPRDEHGHELTTAREILQSAGAQLASSDVVLDAVSVQGDERFRDVLATPDDPYRGSVVVVDGHVEAADSHGSIRAVDEREARVGFSAPRGMRARDDASKIVILVFLTFRTFQSCLSAADEWRPGSLRRRRPAADVPNLPQDPLHHLEHRAHLLFHPLHLPEQVHALVLHEPLHHVHLV